MDREISDVAAFHELIGYKNRHIDLRWLDTTESKTVLLRRLGMMLEELSELSIAVSRGDAEDVVDSLVDLCYFLKGTAEILRLPWTELWEDVHRANMAKRAGMTKRGVAHDASKPEGWRPPNIKGILQKEGLL